MAKEIDDEEYKPKNQRNGDVAFVGQPATGMAAGGWRGHVNSGTASGRKIVAIWRVGLIGSRGWRGWRGSSGVV